MPRPRTMNGYSIAELTHMLESSRTKVAGLAKEKAKLEKRLAEIDRDLHSFGAGGGAGRTRGGRPQNKLSLSDAIVEVLKSSGKPLKVSEIDGAVQKAGYRTTSPNFRSIVNQALIKDQRFQKGSDRGTYLLKK